MVESTRPLTEQERQRLERVRDSIRRGDLDERPGCLTVAAVVVILPGVLALALMPVFQRTLGPGQLATAMLVTIGAGGAAGLAAVLLLPRVLARAGFRLLGIFDRSLRMEDTAAAVSADLDAGTVRRLEFDVDGVWELSESADDDSPAYIFRLPGERALVFTSQRLWDDLGVPGPEGASEDAAFVPRRLLVEWLEHSGDLLTLRGSGERVRVGSIEAGASEVPSAGEDGGIRECAAVEVRALGPRVRAAIGRGG